MSPIATYTVSGKDSESISRMHHYTLSLFKLTYRKASRSIWLRCTLDDVVSKDLHDTTLVVQFGAKNTRLFSQIEHDLNALAKTVDPELQISTTFTE